MCSPATGAGQRCAKQIHQECSKLRCLHGDRLSNQMRITVAFGSVRSRQLTVPISGKVFFSPAHVREGQFNASLFFTQEARAEVRRILQARGMDFISCTPQHGSPYSLNRATEVLAWVEDHNAKVSVANSLAKLLTYKYGFYLFMTWGSRRSCMTFLLSDFTKTCSNLRRYGRTVRVNPS